MSNLKYILIAFCFLLQLNGFSQSFVKSFDFGNMDAGFNAFETPQGEYIVMGTSVTYDGWWVDEGNLIFLKTDADGNEILSVTSSQTIKEYGASCQTSDDHIVNASIIIDESDPSPLTDDKIYLEKRDYNGDIIWDHIHDTPIPLPIFENADYHISDIIETTDGGFVITGNQANQPTSAETVYKRPIFLMKFDANGQVVWTQYNNVYPDVDPNPGTSNGDMEWHAGRIVELEDGTFKFGLLTFNHTSGLRVVTLDPNGEFISGLVINDFPIDNYPDTLVFCGYCDNGLFKGANALLPQTNGDIIVAGTGDLNFTSNPTVGIIWNRLFIMRINSAGEAINVKVPHLEELITHGAYNPTLLDLIQLDDGGFILTTGMRTENSPGNVKVTLIRMDENFDVIWIKKFGDDFPYFNENYSGESVILTSDGHFLIAGSKSVINPQAPVPAAGDNIITEDFYLIKTDGAPQVINRLSGRIERDQNGDCIQDTDATGMKEWLASIEGENTYLAVSDEDGNYSVDIYESGELDIQVLEHGSNLWENCEDNVTINFPSYGDTIIQDFQIQPILDCPFLEIEVGVPFLRRCIQNNTYTIDYCNLGTIAATNPYVEIEFPEEMEYVTSSIPLTSQNGTLYTFNVEDLDVQECGSFTVEIAMCIVEDNNRTYCVEAHIYPDTICTPMDPLWDGSNIALNANCENDTIYFLINNDGDGDMQMARSYYVIEDEIMMMQGSFDLESGQSFSLPVEATGSSYRMEAEQSEGHPFSMLTNVTIEGCGGAISPSNLFAQYQDDDGSPFVDIDCQRVIGSFDPNDKAATPGGVTESHYIRSNRAMEYKIRFQNTGNDTAFTVILLDTLTSFLNPTTVDAGASSHDYRLDILNNNILQFTFDNILLPDSTTNESASHGFVKFKIDQQENLQDGDIIYNSAAIYFDYNDPIITNQTYQEINDAFFDNFPTKLLEIEGKANVQFFPNPVTDIGQFVFPEFDSGSTYQIRIYNTVGQLQQDLVVNQNPFVFHSKELPTGIYYYEILNGKAGIDSGKIIVE